MVFELASKNTFEKVSFLPAAGRSFGSVEARPELCRGVEKQRKEHDALTQTFICSFVLIQKNRISFAPKL